MSTRFLVLGGGEGWHASELLAAAQRADCELLSSSYESLVGQIDVSGTPQLSSSAGSLDQFDAVLTRTMPAGSLEQITFRLSTLHAYQSRGHTIVNSPRGLEIAIDKFATLEHIARLGYDVPETLVVQTRAAAIDAFKSLGGDCIVKPLFGGEGRGVMRIQDTELAWYTFATLDQLDAVFYIQKFVPPGGSDTRLLIVGEHVVAIRRQNQQNFRTNVTGGATCQRIDPPQDFVQMARQIVDTMGLRFASVDILDSDDGRPRVLEVNAIPGWRGAQAVVGDSIADKIIGLLINESQCRRSVRDA